MPEPVNEPVLWKPAVDATLRVASERSSPPGLTVALAPAVMEVIL